ncbi:MAG TPA: phytoene/squalene synthase family protein [Alphaproteobacteria bacterium]|nr:phytoene/squalene synthase family protein [Alphaproteobacteria bacterium]
MADATGALDEEAARYCADQVRRFDHDRYLCALFMPTPARPATLALYAFNVEVARIRELVREPMMGQIRLQWWREVIEHAPQGDLRQHPVAQSLGAAIRAHALPQGPFEALLVARERDLDNEPPETLSELEAYAQATSSGLIELSLHLLGERGAAVREAAQHVGIAWALTGLLRAMPYHASRRQIFLPRDMSAAAGLDIEAMIAGRAGEPLRVVARQVGDAARVHLRKARALRADVPRTAVPALLPAVLADRYLGRLERRGFSLFDPSVQRPAGDRAARLLWASLRGRY